MAVTYSTAAKTARLNAIVALIDVGDPTPGYIEIGTSGMSTVLATLTLVVPCGTVTNGVLTFDFTPPVSDTSADDTGTAAAAVIKDNSGTVIISGLTVGTSATDIILDSVSITAGQTVTLTSGTITHA